MSQSPKVLSPDPGADPAQNLTGSNHNHKNFDRCKPARKFFLGLLEGSGGMLPKENFENLTSQMGKSCFLWHFIILSLHRYFMTFYLV